MTERVNNAPTVYLRRSSTWLVGGFAAVALLLGVVGLYGVIAYSVSQRTREIGVRIALGAQRGTVYRLILKEAGVLALAGIVIGIGCAILAASLMRKLLFGTPPWDITTLVCVAGCVRSLCVIGQLPSGTTRRISRSDYSIEGGVNSKKTIHRLFDSTLCASSAFSVSLR